jgi:hypothetical protein
VNAEQVGQSLNVIKNDLAALLDRSSSTRVLQNAISQAQGTYALYQKYAGKTHLTNEITKSGWGFSIPRNDPLRFNQTTISDYLFRIDLTGEFYWTNSKPVKRNIGVRLWALNRQMFFREEWDAERIASGVANERVMMRFHFDMADSNQSAPLSHLQMGGVADDSEYCWFHPKIEKPRFPHMPMDLILVCELLGMTFYEPEYKKIRKSGLWKGELRKSQNDLLHDYFTGCLQAIAQDKSVLIDYMWQILG